MRQLCEVLAYLHGQTTPIVHRELKPENILLDEPDRIVLIDFGIAKESADATVTRTPARAATHGFSPPEHVRAPGRTNARKADRAEAAFRRSAVWL
ncbi:MAG: protein kinase domain-containing protein [Gammaproteobacteria bacterium]